MPRLQLDPAGVELRHWMGVDNLVWGSDFPHQESSFPHSLEEIEDKFPEIIESIYSNFRYAYRAKDHHYREMAEADLFTTQWVKVDLAAEEFPGYKGERTVCADFHRLTEEWLRLMRFRAVGIGARLQLEWRRLLSAQNHFRDDSSRSRGSLKRGSRRV